MFEIINWIVCVFKAFWLMQDELNKIVKPETEIVHPETTVPPMLKLVNRYADAEKPEGKVRLMTEFCKVVRVDLIAKV